MAIRLGLRCKFDCELLQLFGVKMLFVDQIKNLGIYNCSDKRFKLACDNCKLKFYRCFNAIYSKSTRYNSKRVALLTCYCIPIVVYATEVDPNKTSVKRLSTQRYIKSLILLMNMSHVILENLLVYVTQRR